MFEELERTLKEIKKELQVFRELFAINLTSFTTKKEVARFLNVAEKTITNYEKDGRFTENIHYFFHDNGKKEYIADAIIKFKQELKNRKYEVKKIEKTINPIASKFLNNRKVVSNG